MYKLLLGKAGEAMKLLHTFVGLAAPLEAFVSIGESVATHAPVVHLVHSWKELGENKNNFPSKSCPLKLLIWVCRFNQGSIQG